MDSYFITLRYNYPVVISMVITDRGFIGYHPQFSETYLIFPQTTGGH